MKSHEGMFGHFHDDVSTISTIIPHMKKGYLFIVNS